jgi:hypothetical protein
MTQSVVAAATTTYTISTMNVSSLAQPCTPSPSTTLRDTRISDRQAVACPWYARSWSAPMPKRIYIDLVEIKSMIQELEEAYEDGDLSSWEEDFIDSIKQQLEQKTELTGKQVEKLIEIYEEYCW